ncbi:MAG: hypothetical protein MR685_02775 [Alistipes sp.]|jgi:hypothetical protein|nr:hypothetical protein [Alistipes sp.]MCI6438968.1 hypothetical protein [Alistipes sp.]MDY3835480.1 hypothetical protein [Candidatus Cryptobacteroides sp.]
MKTTLKYIALSMSAALMAACSPDYITPDQAKLPQAADFDVQVEVNQETNYVTFNMNNNGIVPVWIVGATDPIDNANGSKVTGKNYAYTGNGLLLRFRDEGKHTVEVKAYNAHGISVGSQMVEFTLNNTYRDPFDPAPYIKALSDGSTKTWEWNHTVAGHFGCGPFGGTGTEWWSAGAEEKKDWSLYDDKITFGADGSYIYDPGDGQLYVNANSGIKSDYATGEDYLVPWEKTTATYSVESNWNDAGVEEIYITLPKGTPMSYVADQTELDDPRYLVLESKPADMKKCLKLVANLKTSGNPDGIAWHYEFVKEGSAGGDVTDPLYGKTSKTWVLDSEANGHLGCGPDQANAAGWWAAGPNEKAGFGLYDDEITFYADGKYVFNPGADGKIYINKDVTAIGPGTTQSEDYDIDWTVQESTYTLNGDVLTFPEGVVIGYVANNESVTNPTYVITENTEDKLVIVANFSGISWQYIYKPKPDVFDVDGPGNFWKSASVSMTYWYSPSDWSGGLNPETETLENNGLKVVIPEGIGGNEWQGQTVFHTDIPMSASKTYDFCVTVEADQDIPAMTFKLAWEGNDNDHEAFYVNDFTVEAGEPATFKMESVVPDVDYDKVVLFVDLGRCTAGTTVTLTKICMQEHK